MEGYTFLIYQFNIFYCKCEPVDFFFEKFNFSILQQVVPEWLISTYIVRIMALKNGFLKVKTVQYNIHVTFNSVPTYYILQYFLQNVKWLIL